MGVVFHPSYGLRVTTRMVCDIAGWGSFLIAVALMQFGFYELGFVIFGSLLFLSTPMG